MTTSDYPNPDRWPDAQVAQQPEPHEEAPSAPVPSVDLVNGMMGRWRRLDAQIAEYDRLHRAEIERLNERRELAVGPIERRVDRLRRHVEQFAVQSWIRFGKTSLRVPNGDIESRPVVHTITTDAVAAREWIVMIPELDKAWDTVPVIHLKEFRAWLDERVSVGDLQRLVIWEGIDGPEFTIVDEDEGWHSEFGGTQEGVWFWTETGAEKYKTAEGEILPGVTWSPKGTFGSGRNFKVKV